VATLTRPHWLRENAGERTPSRIIVLDTESRLLETEPREVHGLRCWVARGIVRDPQQSKVTECAQFEGDDAREIAGLIERTVKSGKPWRLFTHNLSFDLGLTKLPLLLIAAGWELGVNNLAADQPWAYFKRKSKGLWLNDSWGWLPVSVEKLAQLQGRRKPKLPADTDDEETWLNRCRADVEIQADALLALMAEWDRRRLGVWSITGPASGWNTFLHFPRREFPNRKGASLIHTETPHEHWKQDRVLIVPDAQARAFERTALYSGRRDVWAVGRLRGGPWAEVDLKTAHLTICATLPLPYRRWAAFDSLALDDWRLGTDAAGLIAECQVRTDSPRYPLRTTGAILHPVGQFATVLAGPEILEARRRGDLLSIGRGYGYHLGHQMQEWAQWCLAILNDTEDAIEPMLKVAVKGWSRSVPGRWAMTHTRAIEQGPSHVEGWAYEQVTIGDPPRRGSIFHLAGQWTESISDEEADDSFPAVLAYIQSYCRLALNRLLDALPAGAVASCNTEGAWAQQSALDGLAVLRLAEAWQETISRSPHDVALAELGRHAAPLTVQIKQTARRLEVLSPQHIRADAERQFSGIPRAAVEAEPDAYTFHTWPKLKGQIEKGDPRGYVRERRTVRLPAVPVSRWAFEDGVCEPVAVAWSPETGNVIQPPSDELLRRHGPLRSLQHPALRKVLTAGTWGGSRVLPSTPTAGTLSRVR
jgi:hypothetical protein